MSSNLSRALLLVVVVIASSTLPAKADVNVGDKPLLSFNAANGGAPVSLAKYKGKIIVVDFWATWCGPCMAEAAHMVQVNNNYAGKGSQFFLALAAKPSGIAAKKRLAELMANPQAKAQFEAAQKNKAAEAELAFAKQLQSDGNDEQAFLKFKSIVTAYPGTPSPDTAKQAVATYEKNPALTQKAADAAAASKAPGMMNMAQNYVKAGRRDLAKQKYREIVISFPGSTPAKQAQAAIDEIDTAATRKP